jgi:hypothetical protein
MGLAHGFLDERGGEGGVSPNEVGDIDDLEVRSRHGESSDSGHRERE